MDIILPLNIFYLLFYLLVENVINQPILCVGYHKTNLEHNKDRQSTQGQHSHM
jgi:hypothetical protein